MPIETLANVSRIILVTAYNPADVSKWSGTLYNMYAALQRNPRGSITHVRGDLALLDLAARAVNKCLEACGITFECRCSTAYGTSNRHRCGGKSSVLRFQDYCDYARDTSRSIKQN
jgi:hypothetical protein